MWTFAIPALCVLAHLYLIVVFLPGTRREIDRRGFRWYDGVSLFGIPLLVIAVIVAHLLRRAEPTWLLVVAFLTVDVFLVGMVLAAVSLLSRRRASV